MIAKTFSGLEEVLAAELTTLGAKDVQPLKRAASFTGDLPLLYKINLWSRSALSILKPMFEFSFQSQQEFYDIMHEYKWDEHFAVDKSIAISTVAIQSVFANTHFLAQRTKDAIADFYRDKYNARPNVNIENPDIKINVYVFKDSCSVSLDSSGMPLFKRGYRKHAGPAPLNEVLAAGLIMLSGWDKKQPMYDPMCGSATFSIEAAMMALNMAPATFRKDFSFKNWQDFDENLWENLRTEARESQKTELPHIEASDVSNKSMAIARQNIMEAGLLGRIVLEKKDFFFSKPSQNRGYLIMNPPYGRRIEKENIHEFYQKIGSTFKHNYSGFHTWIISPDKTLTHKIGLKPIAKYYVFNGQLDCTFLGYKIYEGSKKPGKPFKKANHS
ncbi:MAG: class I SAM-dependent RNA methyltransferase [Bacteroidetes bacterium]|nr:MAG: class I SAM-dependent RNA methyltransferase [Bacteroidota bacterium]